MAVVDLRSADPDQPRHLLHVDAMMRHLDRLGADSRFNLLTDQSAGNRVDVLLDIDRTATTDGDVCQDVVGVEPAVRKSTQMRLFDCKTILAAVVAAGDQCSDEVHVVFTTGEVAATA